MFFALFQCRFYNTVKERTNEFARRLSREERERDEACYNPQQDARLNSPSQRSQKSEERNQFEDESGGTTKTPATFTKG